MATFSKSVRLRRGEEFRPPLNLGEKVVCGPFVVFAYVRTDLEPDQKTRLARLGLIVSRKVGNSVIRNKVKRCLREAFRHEQENLLTESTEPPLASLAGVDLVVIARPSSADLSGTEIRQAFNKCTNRLRRQLCRPNGTKNPNPPRQGSP